jgi:hypothetical protein
MEDIQAVGVFLLDIELELYTARGSVSDSQLGRIYQSLLLTREPHIEVHW